MNEQKILTGKGITVAVLDTGIFPHIDFDNRIAAFRDLVYGRETPYDDNGHGTHVCGILGGSGRASGGKYRGTAPECRFVVAKILDRRGNGRKQDILAAIDWVCKERIRLNIRILNISVGTTEQEKSVDDLLVQAVERAWKTSHFLRAWKKQEGICGEERHLDGGTAGVRSRGFGT